MEPLGASIYAAQRFRESIPFGRDYIIPVNQGEHESNDQYRAERPEKHVENDKYTEQYRKQDQQQEKGNPLYPAGGFFLLTDVGLCPSVR
jgi:hypothetical protein